MFAAIVAAAALVRIALMANGTGRLDDPDHYLTLARSLAEGQGFAIDGHPTAYRPPLYPILLAPLVGALSLRDLPWGVGGLNLALGVGTVLFVARAAKLWGLSPGRSLVAMAIVAFDPVLVVQSRSVMTETPAAFLVAASVAGLALPGPKGAILGGVGLGLASLCRPSLLPAAILCTVAALAFGPGTWKVRANRSWLLAMATLLTLAPWAWRNARVIGEPVWTTTHGGYTLALANNPVYYADVLDGPPGAVWTGPNQAEWFAEVGRSTGGMSEPEADRWLRSRALQILRDRPSTFFRASIARLGRFWGVAPSGEVYPGWLRALSTAWTIPLWLALVVGLSSRPARRWPRVAAPSIVIALTIVHMAYWTDLRMRAPLVPAIALIAAGARFPASRTAGRSDQVIGSSGGLTSPVSA